VLRRVSGVSDYVITATVGSARGGTTDITVDLASRTGGPVDGATVEIGAILPLMGHATPPVTADSTQVPLMMTGTGSCSWPSTARTALSPSPCRFRSAADTPRRSHRHDPQVSADDADRHITNRERTPEMSTSALPNAAGGIAGSPVNAVSSTTASQSTTGSFAAKVGAFGVLFGTAMSLVALSWDIQWHKEVGPDTFFTVPHLFLYGGSAIAGVASLVMVLLATSAQRAGRPMSRTVGGTPIRVFGGTFTAPLGYLVSGIGAAAFLLYGLLDLQWHSIYMVGSVIVFAAAREQRWGQIGVVLSIPILITFAPIPANGLSNLSLPFPPVIAAIILFSPLLLILGRGVLRRPGSAIAIAAVLGIMQAGLWAFSPWAAHAYAGATGLPLRDGLTPAPPQLPGTMPMFLTIAAITVEVFFWLISSRNLNAKKVLLLAGAVAGLITAGGLPLQLAITDPTSSIAPAAIMMITIIGLPLGVLAGYLAARFTTMMNALAPATREA
jgi:hypothetical protein